ncbi:hypothetical protein EMIT0324P_90211 [Pseudomonas chlororaphis]
MAAAILAEAQSSIAYSNRTKEDFFKALILSPSISIYLSIF